MSHREIEVKLFIPTETFLESLAILRGFSIPKHIRRYEFLCGMPALKLIDIGEGRDTFYSMPSTDWVRMRKQTSLMHPKGRLVATLKHTDKETVQDRKEINLHFDAPEEAASATAFIQYISAQPPIGEIFAKWVVLENVKEDVIISAYVTNFKHPSGRYGVYLESEARTLKIANRWTGRFLNFFRAGEVQTRSLYDLSLGSERIIDKELSKLMSIFERTRQEVAMETLYRQLGESNA